MDANVGLGRDRAVWSAPFALGVFLIVLGVVAFLLAGLASLTSIVALAILLVAEGVTEMVYAIRARKHDRFTLPFLSGVLTLVVGGVFLLRPVAGLAAISLMLAAYFFATGLFRAVASLVERKPNWGYDLFYGAITVFLGILLLAGWPANAFWLLGALIGIELVLRGAAILGASLALRRALQPA